MPAACSVSAAAPCSAGRPPPVGRFRRLWWGAAYDLHLLTDRRSRKRWAGYQLHDHTRLASLAIYACCVIQCLDVFRLLAGRWLWRSFVGQSAELCFHALPVRAGMLFCLLPAPASPALAALFWKELAPWPARRSWFDGRVYDRVVGNDAGPDCAGRCAARNLGFFQC